MKATTKRKISAIAGVCVNFLTVGVICFSSAYLMEKTYYSYIFVSGGSMNPTLIGGHGSGALPPRYDSASGTVLPGDRVHYGTVDESDKAKRNIGRFDIVTTYYPWSDYKPDGSLIDNPDYKIKRVIALPGETFKISQGILSVLVDGEYQVVDRAFSIDDGGNTSVKDIGETTLGEDEYWLLGDHRSNSSDCGSSKKAVKYSNLIGVLISIEGTAEFYYHYHCSKCGKEVDDTAYLMGEITYCDCGGSIQRGDGDIRNKEYAPLKLI